MQRKGLLDFLGLGTPDVPDDPSTIRSIEVLQNLLQWLRQDVDTNYPREIQKHEERLETLRAALEEVRDQTIPRYEERLELLLEERDMGLGKSATPGTKGFYLDEYLRLAASTADSYVTTAESGNYDDDIESLIDEMRYAVISHFDELAQGDGHGETPESLLPAQAQMVEMADAAEQRIREDHGRRQAEAAREEREGIDRMFPGAKADGRDYTADIAVAAAELEGLLAEAEALVATPLASEDIRNEVIAGLADIAGRLSALYFKIPVSDYDANPIAEGRDLSSELSDAQVWLDDQWTAIRAASLSGDGAPTLHSVIATLERAA